MQIFCIGFIILTRREALALLQLVPKRYVRQSCHPRKTDPSASRVFIKEPVCVIYDCIFFTERQGRVASIPDCYSGAQRFNNPDQD
jgi:hypothetical protein